MRIMSLKRWFKRIWLAPLFLLLGNEGGAVGDIGEGGAGGGGNEGDKGGESVSLLGGGGGADGTPADDLTALFSAEEITAKKESLTVAKAEEDRRAALTDEERAAEDAAKAEEAEKNKVPDEYADFNLPEGINTNAEILGEFKTMAKDLGLSQAKAQQLVDLQVKTVQKMSQDAVDTWNNDIKTRRDAISADKELGGNNLKTTTENAERILNTFLSKEEKDAFVKEYLSRFGDHIGLMRLFNNVTKAISEDSIVIPGKGGNASKTAAEVLYGGGS